MSTRLDRLLENHGKIVDGKAQISLAQPKYKSYAVSTLRGGVGKSSLSFNLAYELSRSTSLLVGDLCPQRNLTDLMMRGRDPAVTVFDALRPAVLGAAFGDTPDDISYRVSEICEEFKGGKRCYFVPGSTDLFSFPSALYQQLQQAHSAPGGQGSTKKLLHTLKGILDREADSKGCSVILMDTSPFYAGGTHLAWCAADAVIIPVRVDEHSVESLGLTLQMLGDANRDFCNWNSRAGGLPGPKIAAIVMTMVGAKSHERNRPDAASCMFIERAMGIANQHPQLFDRDPAELFVITDDFMSSGRISGAKSIPISRLKVHSFHNVEGKRLQVNQSVERYARELQYLASIV